MMCKGILTEQDPNKIREREKKVSKLDIHDGYCAVEGQAKVNGITINGI